jgi:hypothetical protein
MPLSRGAFRHLREQLQEGVPVHTHAGADVCARPISSGQSAGNRTLQRVRNEEVGDGAGWMGVCCGTCSSTAAHRLFMRPKHPPSSSNGRDVFKSKRSICLKSTATTNLNQRPTTAGLSKLILCAQLRKAGISSPISWQLPLVR